MKSPLNEGAFPAPPLQVLASSGCVLARPRVAFWACHCADRARMENNTSISGKKCCSAAADYYSDFRDIEIKVRPIGEPIHSVPRAMLTEFHSPITNPFDSGSRNATNNDESDSPLRLGLCGSGFGVRDSALAFPPPTSLIRGHSVCNT